MEYKNHQVFAQKRGPIVRIAAMDAVACYGERSASNAAKSDVVQHSRFASLEYGSEDIRINAVCPRAHCWVGLPRQP